MASDTVLASEKVVASVAMTVVAESAAVACTVVMGFIGDKLGIYTNKNKISIYKHYKDILNNI